MTERFELIPFHSHQIFTVKTDDAILVVMKPIVETLGLAWHGQFERINRHPVISKGIRVTRIPSAGGMQDAVSLELEQFHGWLVTISPDRVRDKQKRQLIVRYQEEAFRVIYEHFHGKMGAAPAKAHALPPVRDIIGLLDAIKKERAPAARKLLYDLLDQRCKASNVDTPPLDALGAASPESDIADAFFAALLELQHRGGEFSLHRNPTMLAVSLPALRSMMNDAGIDCPPDKLLWKALRQHPAYEFSGNINCKDEKIRRCWVFRRADLFGFEPRPPKLISVPR